MEPGTVPFRRIFSIAWKFALLIALIAFAGQTSDWLAQRLDPAMTPRTEPALQRVIMLAIAAYTFLMALPFVPGVEIGLGLLMTFGARVAPLVYASTAVALTLAFLVGRLVPEKVIIRLLRKARLRRAADLLTILSPLDDEQRLNFLLRATPGRFLPFLLRYRFILLMLALNLPGNVLIGGGGGICMVAGFCRLFSFGGFFVSMAIAVAPVPLLIYFLH